MQVKEDFMQCIVSTIQDHTIPLSLVLNFNETGIPVVPVSMWTLAKKGSSKVLITRIEDKHQIAAVLLCTAMGELLDPQLLYQGTNK